ncbi:MAG: hypothetical protein WCI61_08070 [Chloroflexota bacterium]
MNLRRLALLACAALLIGCTRQPSTPAPEASATVTAGTANATTQTQGTATPSGTPAPTTYVEVSTGKTSTTPPSAEFPKAAPLGAQREVDKSQLPSDALRGAADPSGRYVAYVVPNAGQWRGTVRDSSTGKEWKVDAVAVCQCDGSSVDTGPVWSSSGRFVAFGTGNWREEKERHVVVVEPGADRVTELPKPAWLRSNRLDGATSWRPGYEVLVVGQIDGVFMYDAAARTSTHMSVGTWPRFIGRDLVQVDLLGRDNKPEQTAFTDIWRGGEVARVPYVGWVPAPAINYADGRLALASQTPGPTCIGVVVAHPALRAPSICIPGANAPAWSPDGRLLTYSCADGASSRSVVLFDPATGTATPIAEHLPASDSTQHYRTTWSTDGRHLRLDPTQIGFGG